MYASCSKTLKNSFNSNHQPYSHFLIGKKDVIHKCFISTKYNRSSKRIHAKLKVILDCTR